MDGSLKQDDYTEYLTGFYLLKYGTPQPSLSRQDSTVRGMKYHATLKAQRKRLSGKEKGSKGKWRRMGGRGGGERGERGGEERGRGERKGGREGERERGRGEEEGDGEGEEEGRRGIERRVEGGEDRRRQELAEARQEGGS